MHGSAEARIVRLRPRTSQRRPWHRCRARDSRATNGTYRGVVDSPLPPAVARARFAQFVERALHAARDRGMTDADIQRATGVGQSTFHRWRRGAGKGLPELERVRAFCRGVGVSIDEAMAALGVRLGRDAAEPEPPMPPEIRTILRRLADPAVPDQHKIVIREMLIMIADRLDAVGRNTRNTSKRREAS